MSRFAMALRSMEQGYDVPGRPAGPVAPNPCAAELGLSATPGYADYDDFTTLDVQKEHTRARRELAEQLDRDEDLTPSEAHWFAYNDRIGTPSSYALAVMMNFLTTTEAIPLFSGTIERLMRRSLVPGRTILVLGGVGAQYREIYPELDRRADAAHLRVLDGFDDPLQAGQRAEELADLRSMTHSVWGRLEALAGDVEQTKEKLRKMGATDIFDTSAPFGLSRFRIRAYRRGRLEPHRQGTGPRKMRWIAE